MVRYLTTLSNQQLSIMIIESLLSDEITSKGSETKLDKILFCSLSNDEAYSYLLKGREIFVNCVLI